MNIDRAIEELNKIVNERSAAKTITAGTNENNMRLKVSDLRLILNAINTLDKSKSECDHKWINAQDNNCEHWKYCLKCHKEVIVSTTTIPPADWELTYANEFNKAYNGILFDDTIMKSIKWNIEFIKKYVLGGDAMELKVDGVTQIDGQGWLQCEDTHDKIYYQGMVCLLCEANFMLRINKDEIRFELNHFYNELLKKEMI